jgi:hypothetical protein
VSEIFANCSLLWYIDFVIIHLLYFMGLFDNIIGTANDGEAATDMDTIIENMAHPKADPVTADEPHEQGGSDSGNRSGDANWAGGGNTGGVWDEDKNGKKTKKDKKNTDDQESNTEKTEKTEDAIDITGIDIGGDMSMIDLTITDAVVMSNPTIAIDEPIVGSMTELVDEPAGEPILSESPSDGASPLSLLDITHDTNPDNMTTEPVTSLLDITEPTPAIGILDMGISTAPDVPTIEKVATPDLSPIEMTPSAIHASPLWGSLGDKIGGFADELRGLKAADEILLQEKQDAKKRLEDAKKAIEDAEIAIDIEIQRIRDDEAAIDDTLASLRRK